MYLNIVYLWYHVSVKKFILLHSFNPIKYVKCIKTLITFITKYNI